MPSIPQFPEFKPITLEDRGFLQNQLWEYQPETSELTFGGLFIWGHSYGLHWSVLDNCLILLCQDPSNGAYFLPAVGPSPRMGIVRDIFSWLKQEKGVEKPRLECADRRFAEEVSANDALKVKPCRDHFDYVYRSEDLINLAGRKYHSKRNFINTLTAKRQFRYQPITEELLPECQRVADEWCRFHRCSEDMNLLDEQVAIAEALGNFSALHLSGGAVMIDDKLEAFSLGELLNSQMGVVHIEKANPHIRGLYALINQQFCEHVFGEIPFVNREQDLGEEGLRKAKLSYHPHHMVEKFLITEKR
jgi:hypothetical protein